VNLRILAEAEAEMESARRYLDGQRAGLGDRFLNDLSATLAAIAERPLIFRRLETLPDDQPYRRARLKVFRYAVVFEQSGDEILVIALAHTSLAQNYWLGRWS
jgi:toxin ParE1/3/4